MNTGNTVEGGASLGGMEIDQPKERVVAFRPSYLDDKALWDSFRRGEEQALITIYNRNIKALFNYGMKFFNEREIIKDSIQELFIELWKNRENLGDTDSVKYYLFTSLRRKIVRTKSKFNFRMLRIQDDMDIETSPIESELIERELDSDRKEKLAFLINRLTKRQRLVIHLRYFEEMEYDEIAGLLNLNKQTIYNLISKAIESLKSHYTSGK